MPQKFTTENLLALLYNETNIHEKLDLIHELKANPQLSESFDEMIETISALDEIALDPHPTSVAIIMEHSAKTQEMQHA